MRVLFHNQRECTAEQSLLLLLTEGTWSTQIKWDKNSLLSNNFTKICRKFDTLPPNGVHGAG